MKSKVIDTSQFIRRIPSRAPSGFTVILYPTERRNPSKTYRFRRAISPRYFRGVYFSKPAIFWTWTRYSYVKSMCTCRRCGRKTLNTKIRLVDLIYVRYILYSKTYKRFNVPSWPSRSTALFHVQRATPKRIANKPLRHLASSIANAYQAFRDLSFVYLCEILFMF